MGWIDEDWAYEKLVRRKTKSIDDNYFYRTYVCIDRNNPPVPGSAPNRDDIPLRARHSISQQFSELENTFKLESSEAFELLRESFLDKFSNELRSELPGFDCVCADVGAKVLERFLRTAWENGGRLHIGYHGTNTENHESIYRNGFMLPGQVKVQNGNTHGCGIYTSIEGNSWLSRQFCNTGDLLICAVVEDEQTDTMKRKRSDPSYISGWRIKRETPHLREVGQARIVKDPAFIVPIATARPIQHQPNQKSNIASSPSVNRNKNGTAWFGRRRALVGEEIAWIAPRIDVNPWARRLIRKRTEKHRDKNRRRDRDAKEDLITNV